MSIIPLHNTPKNTFFPLVHKHCNRAIKLSTTSVWFQNQLTNFLVANISFPICTSCTSKEKLRINVKCVINLYPTLYLQHC